jgi:undecaprenyl-diphosphatase
VTTARKQTAPPECAAGPSLRCGTTFPGAAVAALLLLALLSLLVQRGAVSEIDESIRARVHRYAFAPITSALGAVTYLGSSTLALPGTLMAASLLLLKRRVRAAVALLLTMIGAGSLQYYLKLVFRRPRPAAFFGLATPDTYSFPSGHSLVACCFCGALALLALSHVRDRGARFAIAGLTAALIMTVGLSRIYLGMHYPSDVLGGYLAGVAWTASVFAAVKPGITGPR